MIRGQGSKPLSFQAEMTHRVGSQSKSGAVAWWIQHDPTINKVSFRERKRLGSNAPSLVALVTFGHSSHTLRLKERFIASNPTLIIWYHMLGFRWIGMGKQCAATTSRLYSRIYTYTYTVPYTVPHRWGIHQKTAHKEKVQVLYHPRIVAWSPSEHKPLLHDFA